MNRCELLYAFYYVFALYPDPASVWVAHGQQAVTSQRFEVGIRSWRETSPTVDSDWDGVRGEGRRVVQEEAGGGVVLVGVSSEKWTRSNIKDKAESRLGRGLPLCCEKLHFIRGLFLFASSLILEAAAETMRRSCKWVSATRRLHECHEATQKTHSESWCHFDHLEVAYHTGFSDSLQCVFYTQKGCAEWSAFW